MVCIQLVDKHTSPNAYWNRKIWNEVNCLQGKRLDLLCLHTVACTVNVLWRSMTKHDQCLFLSLLRVFILVSQSKEIIQLVTMPTSHSGRLFLFFIIVRQNTSFSEIFSFNMGLVLSLFSPGFHSNHHDHGVTMLQCAHTRWYSDVISTNSSLVLIQEWKWRHITSPGYCSVGPRVRRAPGPGKALWCFPRSPQALV